MRPPSAYSAAWRCAAHGDVPPLRLMSSVSLEAVDAVRTQSTVPCWLLAPLPNGWSLSGIGYAGDGRTGALATVFACTGPAPLGGPGDLVIVAEQPGVGLGAAYAGIAGPDPGAALDGGRRAATVRAEKHPVAMWTVESPADRYAVVGEAMGQWLWAVLWPAAAGHLLAEELCLADVRRGRPGELPLGARTPYLSLRG